MSSQTDTAMTRVLLQYFSQGMLSTPPLVNHAPPDWLPPLPAQADGPRRIIATTGGLTVHLDGLNTLLALVVCNRDPTNFIEVLWTYTDAVPTAYNNKQQVPPGATILIPGPITIASNLQFIANTANCQVDWSYIGT